MDWTCYYVIMRYVLNFVHYILIFVYGIILTFTLAPDEPTLALFGVLIAIELLSLINYFS